MTDLRKAAEMALNALEFNCPVIEDYGSKEQLKTYNESTMALYKALAQPEQEPFKPDWVSYRQGVVDGAAQPEQEEVKVDIGVDVTAAGTSVVAFNCRADGARECFYAEWHPMPKRVPVEWDDDEWVKKAMEMSRDFVARAKARQQPPATDTITMAELRKTDLYRKVQTQLLRDILRDDNT